MKTTNTEKMVKIQILDETGHTTLRQRIEQAATKVAEQVFQHGKWLFVQDKPFEFNATKIDPKDPIFMADMVRLKDLFNASANPTARLTGQLQGGTTTTKHIVTKKPLKSFLNKKTRAQLMVSVRNEGGNTRVRVFVSSYRKGLKRLKLIEQDIASAIYDALRS